MKLSSIDFKNVTLLIPTWNSRTDYLNRILSYYADVPISVVVCDMSEKPFLFKDNYNITYLHYPNMLWQERVWRASSIIKTKYIAGISEIFSG